MEDVSIVSENNPPIVQLYGQKEQHWEAYIVANKEGLLKLKEAIDNALAEGISFVTEFVADGEGYDIIIIDKEEHWQDQSWQTLRLPYTEEYYHYTSDTIHPYDLLTEKQKEDYAKHARGEHEKKE